MSGSHLSFSRIRFLAGALLGGALLGVTMARADTTGVAGSSLPFSNTQPSEAVQWYIATQGVFPVRDNTGGDASGVYLAEVRAFSQTNTTLLTDHGWQPCDGRLLNITQYAALFSLLGTTYGGDGKTSFALPNLRGRVIVGAGEGVGLVPRQLGETGGSETVTLSTANLPTHTHTISGGSTSAAGSGQAFDNMQPWLALNAFIMNTGVFGQEIGWVRFTAASFVPGGYPCDGRSLAIAQDEVLYAVIGTTYGGDGQTTFAVPDLRGRVVVGAGQGTGLSSRRLGEMAGTETVTLTTSTMAGHTHTIAGGATGSTGGNAAHGTMQPYTAMSWVIATQGVFGYATDSESAVGELRVWAGTGAPSGFVAANGALLAISPNQAFFALVGVTYGGNGSSTFGVPDLRSRAAAFTSATRELGSSWGTESVTLLTSNLATHVHTYTPPILAPTVTTATQTSVATTSATLGGEVTSDGGASVSERGIVWATTANPTTANNKVAIGTGTGAFSQSVTDLPIGTTLHVRAYAINSIGTSYGSDVSFDTLADTVAPTITSIARLTPAAQTSTDGTTSFTFRVTYSEAVQNVTTAQFSVEAVNGSNITGTVASVSGTGTTRDVAITITGGTGEFRLKAVD